MTPQHHPNHATWECEYHVVFIPKHRKKRILCAVIHRENETASSRSASYLQLSRWFLINIYPIAVPRGTSSVSFEASRGQKYESCVGDGGTFSHVCLGPGTQQTSEP